MYSSTASKKPFHSLKFATCCSRINWINLSFKGKDDFTAMFCDQWICPDESVHIKYSQSTWKWGKTINKLVCYNKLVKKLVCGRINQDFCNSIRLHSQNPFSSTVEPESRDVFVIFKLTNSNLSFSPSHFHSEFYIAI